MRSAGVLAALAAAAVAGWSQSGECGRSDARTASLAFRLNGAGDGCLGVNGGFSGESGSFAGVGASAVDGLGLGETLTAGIQYGVRLRKAQLGFTRPFLAGKRLEAGFTLEGQRFSFNQGREASILAFSRDVSEFDPSKPDNLMRYTSRSYGGTAFARYGLSGGVAHVGLTYSFDTTGATPVTPAASAWFGALHFLNGSSVNGLSGIRTSKATAAYVYNTVDDALRPTRGVAFSASMAVAGLGGDVNTIEPAIDAKWFHRGIRRRHTIAAHLDGRMIVGYDGKAAPAFDRYYMGGEDEIRGFASWSVSPITYVPALANAPVLNDNGTNRTATGGVAVTMAIPVYRPVSVGGDTKVVGNIEYRIPLVGPLTLALFTDAGVDRDTFGGETRLNAGVIAGLNGEFDQTGFTNHATLQSGSEIVRMSSGVELQAVIPKVRVPVRFYWAYNVLACGSPGSAFEWDQIPACNMAAPPVAAARNYFPNYATFANALMQYGGPSVFKEPRSLLRIAVGFTF